VKRYVTQLRYLLIALIMISVHPCVADSSQPTRIAIIISGPSEINLGAVRGFKERVVQLVTGIVDIKTIDIAANNNVDENIYKDTDYLITVGSESIHKILQDGASLPVISILVPEITYKTFARNIYGNNPVPDNYSVIYLDQPEERILRLARMIVDNPEARIGMAFGEQSISKRKHMIKTAKKLGIELVHNKIENEKDVVKEMSKLLNASDVFIALYDSRVLNRRTAKWLLHAAYKYKKPVIGYSNAFVRAGAVAAVYSTPDMFGTMSAEWLAERINGRAVKRWIKHPDKFTISVNRSMSRQLGLRIDGNASLVNRLVNGE